MKRMMQLFTVICMALFLCGMVIIPAVHGNDETYSYYENRNLSAIPELTASSALDGSYQDGLDKYLTDHAPLRITLLKFKTILDEYVLRRPVVNKVVVCDDVLLPYLTRKDFDPEQVKEQASHYAEELATLQEQIEEYGGHYLHVGVPCQYAYFEDSYPWYLDNREAYTDTSVAAFTEAMAEEGVAFLDMGLILEAAGHPQSYGSTVDNHFSIYGAYLTYQSIVEYLNTHMDAGLIFPSGDEILFEELPNRYMGSRTRMLYGICSVKDTLSIARFTEEIPFVRRNNGIEVAASVYSSNINSPYNALLYGIYMGGDVAYTEIETSRPELPSVLIYGDSFTNGVECLAYYSFDKMESIDLRYYSEESLSDHIAMTKPDYVICIRDYEALIVNTGNGNVFGKG